jgi:hypothetical protein
MQRPSLRYNAYLIRLWEEGAPGAWRASAQHVQSGESVRFADAAHLFAFLQSQLDNVAEAKPADTHRAAQAQGSPDNALEPG